MPTFPYHIGIGSSGYPGRAGPFPTSSTTRYAIMQGNNPSQGGAQSLRAAKSTDNGVTWNVFDDADAPLSSSVYTAEIIGGVIWCVFLDVAQALKACPFTPGADTWGTVTASGLTMTSGSSFAITSAYRSHDGKLAFTVVNGQVTMMSGDTLNTLDFGVFDPGSVSFGMLAALGYIDVSGGQPQGMTPNRMVEGSSGIVHCAFSQLNGGGAVPGRLLLQGVDASGVMGLLVEEIVDTIPGDTDTAVTMDMGYQASTDTLFLGYTNFDPGTGINDGTDVVVKKGASILNMIFTPAAVLASPEDIYDNGLAFGVDSSVVDVFIGTEATNNDFYISVDLGGFTLFGSSRFSFDAGTGMEAVLFTFPIFGLLWQSDYWEQSVAVAKWRTREM